MKSKTKKGIDMALDDYNYDMIEAATAIAVKAHIVGDMRAFGLLKMPIANNLVQQEALEFGKGYRALLKKKGASIIRGKEIPWLAEQKKSTRDSVFQVIQNGLKEGKSVADIGGKRGVPGTIAHDLKELVIREKDFEYVRIARTETARIQNQGTLNRYDKNNITHVNVIDGDGCDECIAANGQVWTVAYSRTHELEHPNCVRAFSAVIPDDWEPPTNT